jgi:hypothetical protein
VIDLARSCSRHRPLLVDFVDRGEVRAGTAAALAHLERCDGCTEAIESTMLTITALRRLGDSTVRVEPRDDAWPRLRARLQSPRPRRLAVMSPLAGVAMSFALVAVMIVPFRLAGGSLLGSAASPTTDRASTMDLAELRLETAYIATVRRHDGSTGIGVAAASASGAASASAFYRIYPDRIHPTRKEVGPAATTTRPSEAS